VCPNGQAISKIKSYSKLDMINSALQISETAINESFKSTNNIFDQFRLFTSSVFSQVFEGITMMSENFLK